MLTSFRLVPKENPFWNSVPCQRKSEKCKKLQQSKKSTKKWFDRTALWRVYVYLISSTSMQKENPVANSSHKIKIRCAKYKFAERNLDKLQTCAKGKSILEFRSVSKEIRTMQKFPTQQKSIQKWFDRAAPWRVYVYLISSTSMQKENPVAKSGHPIKIHCVK